MSEPGRLDFVSLGLIGPSSKRELILSQSLSYIVEPLPLEHRRVAGLSLLAWVKILLVAILFAATFRFSFMRLWAKTNPLSGEPNWGHSTIVPLIGLYYLYTNREALLAAKVKPTWHGVAALLTGLLIFAYGIFPGYNDYIKDVGMVVTLFGVVLALCGWEVMKIAWFPIAFLFCAIPWPGLVYSWIASPLQHLAAKVAVGALSFTGVIARNEGTKILMEGADGQMRTLEVAQACAGLRSLMTFISVGAAVAFLSVRPLWQKIIITLSAIPIAIGCNVMRVAGQGLLDRYVSQQFSESFAHQFVGLIMLMPAFFLILLVGWVLDRIFVEEVDAADAADARLVQRGSPMPAAIEPVTQATPRQQATESVTQATQAPEAERSTQSPRAIHLPPPPATSVRRRMPGGDI